MRTPSAVNWPSALIRITPSFWVPPTTLIGPPKNPPLTPLRLKPRSLKSIRPDTWLSNGKFLISITSLLRSWTSPDTLASTICAKGRSKCSFNLALPLTLVSWVKLPVHSSTGLIAIYRNKSCATPLALPSMISLGLVLSKSGMRAWTLDTGTFWVSPESALISMLSRSNTILPCNLLSTGQYGLTPSLPNTPGK